MPSPKLQRPYTGLGPGQQKNLERWVHAGSQQSALAYFAVLARGRESRLIFDQRLVQICQFEVRSGYDLAALRAHVSLPPLLLRGSLKYPTHVGLVLAAALQ